MTKIIVELCQNHLGDRALLARMISAAAENGAEYVKTQSIFSEDLTCRKQFENGVVEHDGTVKVIKRPYQSEYERLSKLDLSIDDHLYFIKECERHNVIPLTTIFARHRVLEIAKLPWPEKVVKVASYDCASLPFLLELAEHFDHLIISTGATYDHEIRKTAHTLAQKGVRVTLLHCVTSYPNTLEMANLKRMEWLKTFTHKVGWSDHTLVERDKLIAAKVAFYLGADYIERHFTILPREKTKDGPVSITPEELRELSEFRKLSASKQKDVLDHEYPDWEILLGVPTRTMTRTELLNRDYYRGRFAHNHDDGTVVYNWE